MKILMLVLYALYARTGETDQYIAGVIKLKDSYQFLNIFYKEKINQAIATATATNEQQSCSQLTDKILSNITNEVGRLSRKSSEIKRYPDNSISNREYFKQSIYKNAGFPLNFTPLARTINIGGIYIGTDKIGHFSLIGRNYYRHYLNFLNNGYKSEEAIEKTILNGIKKEMNILGYHYNGVFSFADMEANYQGLRFALLLCQEKNSYLKIENGQWVKNQNREFDIRDYINPKMDESYNTSFRRPSLWNKIKNTIRDIYCEIKNSSVYQEKIANYKLKQKDTFNDQIITEYFRSRPEFDRSFESVDNLCL